MDTNQERGRIGFQAGKKGGLEFLCRPKGSYYRTVGNKVRKTMERLYRSLIKWYTYCYNCGIRPGEEMLSVQEGQSRREPGM